VIGCPNLEINGSREIAREKHSFCLIFSLPPTQQNGPNTSQIMIYRLDAGKKTLPEAENSELQQTPKN
jgi:hypothetical protein